MLITVVIPTFNRAFTLQECLEALFQQDFPAKDFEVIVVDDGSRDATRSMVHSFQKKHKNLFYFHQSNQGQGIARNCGVQKAHGDIIILIGDDIIVAPDFLNQHMKVHLRHPAENVAVLGYIAWHPKLPISPFMQWLTNGSSILGRFGGHQFAYEKLEGKDEADYNFFYTSNISIKKSLLEKYPFDPDFAGYGWEDIELGYRLYKKVHLILRYNPSAIGYHDHLLNEEGMVDRMRNIGRSAWIIHRKYPELAKVPSASKRVAFWLLSNRITLSFFKFIRHVTQEKCVALYFYALSKKYFMEGIRSVEK